MRYFFNTYDNGETIRDEDGCEFCNDGTARNEAMRFLANIVSELTISEFEGRKFGVEVTDENGRAVAPR